MDFALGISIENDVYVPLSRFFFQKGDANPSTTLTKIFNCLYSMNHNHGVRHDFAQQISSC